MTAGLFTGSSLVAELEHWRGDRTWRDSRSSTLKREILAAGCGKTGKPLKEGLGSCSKRALAELPAKVRSDAPDRLPQDRDAFVSRVAPIAVITSWYGDAGSAVIDFADVGRPTGHCRQAPFFCGPQA
jgi:hypothetical protein